MGMIGRFAGFVFILAGLFMLLQSYFAQGSAGELRDFMHQSPLIGKFVVSDVNEYGEEIYHDSQPYFVSGMALVAVGLILRLIH